ncbi:hypothetical protein [Pantoea sp. aB]|jgi:hypothetical protein|uniref:hypothetical protein n=1 Tax=Pantoea sp. aB TaxID=517433 RepID=UPI0001E0B419|nr:hypothetical protein [Pantoea sp. aB]EFM17713.1 hypothetical protein PanABDRAFT_4224 [Pantoea sp. aB]
MDQGKNRVALARPQPLTIERIEKHSGFCRYALWDENGSCIALVSEQELAESYVVMDDVSHLKPYQQRAIMELKILSDIEDQMIKMMQDSPHFQELSPVESQLMLAQRGAISLCNKLLATRIRGFYLPEY